MSSGEEFGSVKSSSYDFLSIERKWQKKWSDSNAFVVSENSSREKCYVLEMFPYPSGSGLHMGHAFNYTIGDIFSRFKRMSGFNVLYPTGYDSFGLPAENAAIKAGVNPKNFTDSAITKFISQQKALGLSYDWDRTLKTSDPEYYKWNQYLFLKLLERGLVYRKKASINWCSKCSTVLANEQVHNGACWRHLDTPVELRHLEQWFIKTTEYADELLNYVDSLQWPERIKSMQKNWIGKSHGTNIIFDINKKFWTIFTTRPDTLFGITFLVVSAQHPLLSDFVVTKQKKSVDSFLRKIRSTKQEDVIDLEKEGVFTGSYAVHPLTGENIPVYAGNFVVADYGSGIVMAVPAHDERDYDFAKKYDIPIKIVVQPKEKKIVPKSLSEAFIGEGVLVNSGSFNGLDSVVAREKITEFLISEKKGGRSVQFKLRDWLVSRQRYWGTPIPVIYCNSCGIVPVPVKDLPILLPANVTFGSGNPLESSDIFVNTKCPRCNSAARRETDTMDTFFDSSWYFLRFANNKNFKAPFDKKIANYWMPVDQYIGGAEHACMHLIYARFFVKALRDIGMVDFGEPFPRLFNQGMIHGVDGFVMSKSRGNVIDPLDSISKYGADSLRVFLISVASPDKDFSWSDTGMESSNKLVQKIFLHLSNVSIGKTSSVDASRINSAIKTVTKNIEQFKYNMAIICLRELFENIGDELSSDDLSSCIRVISPFCPHICEELWELHGFQGFASHSSWPSCDDSRIDNSLDAKENLVDQIVKDIYHVMELNKIRSCEKITIFVAEPWKFDLFSSVKKLLDDSRDVGFILRKVLIGDMKKQSPEVSRLVPLLIKDTKKVSGVILSQNEEFEVLKKSNKIISEKCGSKEVLVIKSQESSDPKARKSLPGKPALLIE
ncbi:leucine--tRNA ligase [Candidatus Woesearchaeota archaeon]|nr:leucine--tRNA ligase [Candidatus Woesearchaeota archaeon]